MVAKKTQAVIKGIKANSMLYSPHSGDATQLAWLYNLAEMAPDGPAIECGVYKGGSFVCWLEARRNRGRIIAVDDWSSKTEYDFYKNVQDLEGIEVFAIKSWEAPERIGEPVAFAFIDSDHGENGITRDIAVWPDCMMPGGILAFHDYAVWKPDVVVKREVDKWQAKAQWQRLGLVSSIIAFRRPIE